MFTYSKNALVDMAAQETLDCINAAVFVMAGANLDPATWVDYNEETRSDSILRIAAIIAQTANAMRR
jgi:hypothetical protein